jgi:putative adenylate-forming enzyme
MPLFLARIAHVFAAVAGGLWDFVRLKWWFWWLRGERLRRFQRRRVDQMVQLAVERSPFYRRLYEGRDLSRFEELPTVDKATMMANFTEFNTAGLDRDALIEFALAMENDADFLRYFDDRYVVGLSSGTSGNKGLVLTDRALSERLPFIFLARSGLPLRHLPFRILFILRVHNQAFENVNSPLITLRYRHLMTPMEEMLGVLNEMRANIVMGPPSVLKMIAEQAEHITAPLRMAVSYAEVLTPEDEAEIRDRLGVKLIQLYQASEGPIGSACKHGRLHVNEDLVYIEGFDEHGNPLPPHQPAHKMLVTNLYNDLQPLIRYELNDLLVFGEPCECGSGYRVIERILGRHDDIFWFPRAEGEGYQHLFPDLARRAVITSTEQVRDYQVVQEAYDRMVVRLVPVDGVDFEQVAATVRASMEAALTRYGCRLPEIEIEQAPPEVNRSSQKLQRVRRAFSHPATE